ncbi:hypothetical protein H5410_048119 [Solanum commersonii]|uniref:Uncharacterized protein n=1 Tax=Solanum commersonii TaxID=4109 RepID=A0A9J5XIV4_SOLCO|nr:hypothetical protein H5410_048119 [Solanum commersonii]
MDELQTILTEAFGDSSNSEGEEEEQFLHVHSAENKVNGKALTGSVFGETHNWERISEIDGLWLCKDFLSPDQQSKLLSSIQQGRSNKAVTGSEKPSSFSLDPEPLWVIGEALPGMSEEASNINPVGTDSQPDTQKKPHNQLQARS